MSAEACTGSGQPLPDDAREEFEADPTCTHFYCPNCAKLLVLPSKPDGVIRKHIAGIPSWAAIVAASEAAEAGATLQ